jgi:DNA-binding Lrp family transcriptional regulator
MHRVKLDKIDRKILFHLQEDGRMTNVELAQKAGHWKKRDIFRATTPFWTPMRWVLA